VLIEPADADRLIGNPDLGEEMYRRLSGFFLALAARLNHDARLAIGSIPDEQSMARLQHFQIVR
jgi:hypothetical protein